MLDHEQQNVLVETEKKGASGRSNLIGHLPFNTYNGMLLI